jgi:hypothetical protein
MTLAELNSETSHPALMTPTPLQMRILAVPEEFDIGLFGGRGGGKTSGICFVSMRHIEMYQGRARVLYVRRSFPGITDFEAVTRDMFGLCCPGSSYNAGSHLWRFRNGATMKLDQYETSADFAKFQGQSYTLIIVDEGGQYPDPALIDLLRSCLRAPEPIKPRLIIAANPGGPGHGWIQRRHVFAAPDGVPYVEPKSGRTFVNINSTWRDNPTIDRDEYRRQLAAACATDPELLRAWDLGDWTVQRGAYFSAVLDADRNMVEPWKLDFGPRKRPDHHADAWSFYLAHDFGVSAPSVTYICAESPGITGPDGRYYPRGSIVLLDEFASNEPGSLERGMGYTVPVLADRIKEMARKWSVRPEGVADDAIFARTGHATGTIGDEFARCGVFFMPAQKGGRTFGWERMRRMLQDAGKPDAPGLYVSRLCSYWWDTVPLLARDPKKSDDVDSRQADHGADACRYALTRIKHSVTVSSFPF